MRGSPARPGGPLTSKPTRSNTFRVSDRVGFFAARGGARGPTTRGDTPTSSHQPRAHRTAARGFRALPRPPAGVGRNRGDAMVPTTRDEPDGPASSRARQIARAACAFERQRTGQVPRSVTVVLSDDT